MANLAEYWRSSLTLRRVVASSVFIVATVAVYLGSNIPRVVSLPVDDLNARSSARVGDEALVVSKPEISEGAAVISYEGNRDELADLRLDSATLDERSQRLLFPGQPFPEPYPISFTTADSLVPIHYQDTCRTNIVVRRSKGASGIDSLRLFQTDQTAGAQRFRQLVIDSGRTPMDIEFSTNSPPNGVKTLPGCAKLLTVGDRKPIVLPPDFAVGVHVPEGKVDFHFSALTSEGSVFTGVGQTLDTVSLGEGILRANRVQVVPLTLAKAQPKLEVRPSPATKMISVGRLKLGADMLKVDVGRDFEKATAYADGVSIYNYDLVALTQKNPILGFVFASLLVPGLVVWVKNNCFPKQGAGD